VLVIDDEPLVRRMSVRTLSAAGYACEEAASGADALAALRDGQRFDLVVLDVAMPGMDGAECFVRLRAIDPAMPILIASGYPKDRRIEDLLALGRAEFISKPSTRADLLAAVERRRRAESPVRGPASTVSVRPI
jgi:CheY-like chemotaxis protein